MRGTRFAVLLAVSLPMAAGSACKKGKETASAADEKREQQPPSGSMSLQGMYSYMADAGIFVDCRTHEQWPVAMEGDNAALERAYGKANVPPGSPLLVTVQGRLEARPRVDRDGTETNLIVDRFMRTWPGETCGNMKEVELEDTHWALLELNGKPVNGGGKVPFLELNSRKASAYGFGGCNRFFGSYEATERSLKLGEMGATRMACPEGMDREQELFTALAATTRYEIHGSKLLLFANETLVARFEARTRPE